MKRLIGSGLIIVYIGNTIMGSYELLTKFPVGGTTDLKGKKIAGAGPNLPWIKAVGAVPVQSSMPEAYTGLQTGVYDGWIVFVSGVVGFKLYEPAKYFTNCHFGSFMGGIITVNLNSWNKLPPEVQKILTDVGRDYTIKMGDVVATKLASDMEKLKTSGCNISTLPQNALDHWAINMPNVAHDFAKKVETQYGLPGSEIVKAYYEIQKELGHKWPRDWTK